MVVVLASVQRMLELSGAVRLSNESIYFCYLYRFFVYVGIVITAVPCVRN